MVRRRVIEKLLKSISTIVGFSGIGVAASHIDETNVKEYYSVLQAMGLSSRLRIDSPFEDVSEVWMSNESMIQKCKSIRFKGESTTELPYNALNEMCSLAELDASGSKLTSISDRIGDLKKLTELNLSHNQLTGIPDRIGDLKNLTWLNLSCNQLTSIPDRIGDLKNLTWLNLSCNQLTSIPDRIGDLSNLTRLDLCWNQLKSIPDRIGDLPKLTELSLLRNQLASIPDRNGDLKNLRGLILSCNQLTSIPDRIGDLKNLTELDLSSNQLTSIPDNIGSLLKLKGLDLSNNLLASIPDRIGDLSNLTRLNLSSNLLASIPDSIGDLKNLARLNLSSNQLTSITDHIGDLKNLIVLDLSSNQLASIPDSIGDLSELEWLYLSSNQLTSIPGRIGDLSNLTRLDLSGNLLASIPDRIGSLLKLKGLCLSSNQLTSISDRIGNLKNLIVLDLSHNRLTSILDDIGDLSKLTGLGLSSNRLTSIPDSIGSLLKLNELSLSNNMLTSVPSTIRNLRNTLGGYVDIKNNVDIIQYGDSEASFGIEQLKEIFGSRLHYIELSVITIEEAYKKLMGMPIYWNFDRLKQLRATPIPQIDMTMDEMMAIWISLPKEGIAESNASAMTDFIHDIYNPDEQYNRNWPMAREYLQLSKNLLGSVLNILSTKSETDKELVESNINSICEGLTYCNDRKLSELRLAYYTLIDKLNNQDETLDSLIDNIISNEKEKVFNFTFIGNTDQNVHLLNYWKYGLRDEVGFDFDVSTIYGTQGQDPFYGHPGNALGAFNSKFTPERAIKELTIRINETENCTYMSELMKTIFNDNELTIEEKESMLAGDIESSMFTEITREGVKYYLLKRGLLIQNQE